MKRRIAAGVIISAAAVAFAGWRFLVDEDDARVAAAPARPTNCAPPGARLRMLEGQGINSVWDGTWLAVRNNGIVACLLRGRPVVHVPAAAPFTVRIRWGYGGDFFPESAPASLRLEPGEEAGAMLIAQQACRDPLHNGTAVPAVVRIPTGGAGVRFPLSGCRNENSTTTLFIGPFERNG